MSRDYEHYVYWTIPVRRGGKTHKAILEDAKEHGNTKQIPLLLSTRIEQFYELKKAGLPMVPPGDQQAIKQEELQQGDDDIEVLKFDQKKVDANFKEASDYWG